MILCSSPTVVFVCLSVCLSVSLCLVRHLGGGPVERSDSVVCVSVCGCLVYYLGGGPVQRSHSGVCLSVCLSVFACLVII